MSDDVYGHSVEDYDMAVSPTTGEDWLICKDSNHPHLMFYNFYQILPIYFEIMETRNEIAYFYVFFCDLNDKQLLL